MSQQTNLVQSLSRGLIALEMAAKGEITPNEVAEELGVDRSSAYRLLYTLVSQGFLIQDRKSRKFVPNVTKFLTLSSRIIQLTNWPKLAETYLKILAKESEESANLGVFENNHVIYIGQEHGSQAVRVYNALGSNRPVHASALGKAIVAFLDETEIERIIGNISFEAFTPKTMTDPQLFRYQLKSVVEKGYAIDDEETYEGVRCMASPIFDYRGNVVGAIGISGPTSRVTLERIPTLAETILRVTKDFSQELGYMKDNR